MRKKNKKTGIFNKVYEDFKIRQKNKDKRNLKFYFLFLNDIWV